jgi:hypothetical protein
VLGEARLNWYAVGIAMIVAMLLIPLCLVRIPALPDYPAHLASFYLIATGAKASAVAHFYRIEWALLPNLAGEILVPLLGHIMSLQTAGKVFLGAAMMMWVLGPALVHRALYGTLGVAPLLGACFAWNANLSWGFLNYYFAMGATFLIFAAWIATEDRRRTSQILGLTVAVTFVYIAHIFAAATLLLLVSSFELGGATRLSQWRPIAKRMSAVALVFAPSIFCYLLLNHAGSPEIAFNLSDRALDKLAAAIVFRFDDPAFVLLAMLCILLAAGLWLGWAVIDRRMIAPLSVLALATSMAPEWAMGGWGVDLRLPAVLGALAFASAEFRLERGKLIALSGALILALIANNAMLTTSWLAYDRQVCELTTALKRLPAGIRLLTVLDGSAIGYGADQPYWHMAELAIISPGAFTPLMFTTEGQHVVHLQPEMLPIAARTAEQGSPPDVDELEDLAANRVDEDEDIANVFPYLMRFQCHYNVAVVIHLGGPRSAVPPLLQLRHAGSFFSFYDILPDSRCIK